MKLETVPTFTARLYLSGPIEVAKQIIRADCLREGLCVTIEPTTFIYTGGEEAGYVVGLVNYPRFPAERVALIQRARDLMLRLLGFRNPGPRGTLLYVAPPEPTEAELVCYEAYQVVGSLLSDLGKFATPEAEKILDNLSQAKMVHKDVLPWESYERSRGVAASDPLIDTQAELDAVSREMEAVYARWPKTKKEDDEHRAIREDLLAPLRARCIEIGQRRYRIATEAQEDAHPSTGGMPREQVREAPYD